LPVEALVDANNRFLGERGPIISSLGIQYEPHEGAGSHVLRDVTALVVAVPAPHSRFTAPLSPLPDVVSEAELVAGKFRSADLLLNQNATLNETLARIPASTVFHFAGHASNSPVKPGLLLFDDTLTVRTLEDADPSKMQLAVFSACDTEDGAVGLPGDSNSVTGHLIRIGVPRVVASRWNVDSNSTREFMRLFYDHLLSGTTVEKAVYEAQSAMRAQRDRRHPFFWAAFTVFGSDTGEK
jgi:CHAT domain-containing protein